MTERSTQRQVPILVYADLEVAYDHLTKAFGLAGHLERDDQGRPVHGELKIGDDVIWLHEESDEYRLASPRGLGAATGMVTIMVDDVDAHFARARDEGAHIVYEPVDQPYGYREYAARDVEDHLWSFMKALGPETMG